MGGISTCCVLTSRTPGTFCATSTARSKRRGTLQRDDTGVGLDGDPVAPRLRVRRQRHLHPRRERPRRDHLAAGISRRHLGTAHQPSATVDHRVVLHLLGVDRPSRRASDRRCPLRRGTAFCPDFSASSRRTSSAAARWFGVSPVISAVALDPLLHPMLERRDDPDAQHVGHAAEQPLTAAAHQHGSCRPRRTRGTWSAAR